MLESVEFYSIESDRRRNSATLARHSSPTAIFRLGGVHHLQIVVDSLLHFSGDPRELSGLGGNSYRCRGKDVLKPQTVTVSLAMLMVVAAPLSAADSTGRSEIRQIKQEI